jgi:predicted O-methyltransferase YrrM
MLLIRNKRLRLLFGALESFSFLALKLWLRNPSRAHAYAGRVFRDYMSLVGKDKWVSLQIEQIFPDMKRSRIVLEHLPGDGVDNSIAELAYLALITQAVRPERIFEIGTFRGRTALNFAVNSGPRSLVYTLDLPPEQRIEALQRTHPADAEIIKNSDTGLYFRERQESEKIHQLYGDSLQFDFTPYLGKMDLVFIDGAHDYNTARSDTANALRMITPGGWIVWHDFGNYGDYNDVTRAVLSLLPPMEVKQIDNSQLAIYRKPGRLAPPRAPTP